MQGLALKNVAVTVYDGGKKPLYEDFGELLFTHFGVSGPLVLSASAHLREFDRKKYRISIDLKPALDEKDLDARLLRDFEKYSNRDFANALGDLLPRLMIPVIVDLSGIPPEQKVHSITKQQRQALLNLIKNFTIEVMGPRPIDEAIITSGGVSTKEISPKTMESKRVPGLYFAGEIIDADAYTGGFNLQIAWSTAYAAATHTVM
jgi:predicted Rossmann fold flavoprotein